MAGKRVVVTRPRGQAEALGRALTEHGAEPIFFPTIHIAPIEENPPLDDAISGLSRFDWIVFTSVNGVTVFFGRLKRRGRAAEDLRGLQVAAIGPATANELRRNGVEPTLVPDEYVAESVVAGLGDVKGSRFLLPRAAKAREVLVTELRNRGAQVEEIPVYETEAAPVDQKALAEIRDGVDAVTFTSSSTVEHFVSQLSDEARRILENTLVACIGPITARTARELGLRVDLVAEEYTADGLARALAAHFATASPS
jgi:uroporphyrinogen III methyltransferase/synthase